MNTERSCWTPRIDTEVQVWDYTSTPNPSFAIWEQVGTVIHNPMGVSKFTFSTPLDELDRANGI